ncbi:hypothetical protein ACP4OV_022616 [Aristida adscensionis]
MAAGERRLVEESTAPMLPGGADPSRSRPQHRPASFLLPRAGGGGARPPASRGPVLARGVRAEFRGWATVPRRWAEWVRRLRPRHEALWREAGILGAVLASARRVRRRQHERALLQLAAFWSAATATFAFPWGEATLTLEDVAALAGLPLLGCPVRAPPPDGLRKDVAAIEALLLRRGRKTAGFRAWAKHFVNRKPEKQTPASAAGDGDGGDLLEHGAFLSMWLSFFVLPAPPFGVVRREVLPLAACLARGQRVALAPAALASIYSDLSALKRHLTSPGEGKPPFVVSSAPMHILLLWVWERFPQLRPEAASSPAPDDRAVVPRAARWQDVAKRLKRKHVHAVFMSPKEFVWMPYGRSSCIHGQDRATTSSFARCLRACELVGMKCIEQYNPHRVARQLGFDQDVPGTVPRVHSKWEKAWDTYNIEPESSALLVPNHDPGVTVDYAQWWSSACATADGLKMKQPAGLVIRIKRKMEEPPATNSSKKLHVDNANERPQPAPDVAEDLLDHIPLAERLNGIINLIDKRHISECLVEGSEQEQITESKKCSIPKSASAGARKGLLLKDVERALPDGVASSDIIVDDLPFGSNTQKVQRESLLHIKAGELNMSDEENNSRTEYGRAVVLNVVQGAVNTTCNEAIGAAAEVDMLPTLEDIVVIGDDDDECDKASGEECQVSVMHLKSPEKETTGSTLQEPNEEKQLISERNSEQDNPVLEKVTVQTGGDYELANALNDVTQIEPDVLTQDSTIQGCICLLEGPSNKEIQACIVAGEIDNRHKRQTEKIASLDCSEQANKEILASKPDIGSLTKECARDNRKRSGNGEMFSNVVVEGHTEQVSSEVCTKTLYYLSRLDRAKDAWEKDANRTSDFYLPRRAVGTMEMIKKASAIRQAEIARLKKKIGNLIKEILMLEGGERGEPPKR